MREREREREREDMHILHGKLRHTNVQMFPGRQLSKNAQNLSSGYTANKNKDTHLYCSNINILHNTIYSWQVREANTTLSLTQSSCQITKHSQYPLFPYIQQAMHTSTTFYTLPVTLQVKNDLIYHCVIVLIVTCN